MTHCDSPSVCEGGGGGEGFVGSRLRYACIGMPIEQCKTVSMFVPCASQAQALRHDLIMWALLRAFVSWKRWFRQQVNHVSAFDVRAYIKHRWQRSATYELPHLSLLVTDHDAVKTLNQRLKFQVASMRKSCSTVVTGLGRGHLVGT